MTLRHQCERDGCYKDRLPDWGILAGCFPRGIRPSDVDGVVELNEYLLMLEWKPRSGQLTRGQLLMFQNVTRGSPKVQCLVIYGDPGMPAEIELYESGMRRFRQACDLEFLRWFCQQWGVFAESRATDRRHDVRRALDRGITSRHRIDGDLRILPDRRSATL